MFTDSSDFKFTLNGGSQSYNLSQVNVVNFFGDGGSDTMTVSGLPGVVTAALSPLTAQITGANYSFSITDTQKILITGAAGDTATFADSPGNDLFEGLPTESLMENFGTNTTTYYNQVNGFSTVGARRPPAMTRRCYTIRPATIRTRPTAAATNWPAAVTRSRPPVLDWRTANSPMAPIPLTCPHRTTENIIYGNANTTANFADSSGNDLFVGLPTYSQMSSLPGNPTTYFMQANGCGHVNATSSGEGDIAALYDSSGNDTYTSNSSGSQMTASGYSVHVAGFPIAYGFLTAGGTDTANLSPNTTTTNYVYGTSSGTINYFDSAGNDTFYEVAQNSYSIMTGPGYYNEGISFGNVAANSVNGGTDTAIFYDSTGGDTYTSQNATSSMTGTGYVAQATGFAVNYAFFVFGGTDTANLYAGTNRTDYVYGTSKDTVNFFSSSNNDLFDGQFPYSLMYYNNYAYSKEAIGFGTVNATASGTNETAYVYDSPGNDAIVAGGTTATLTMPGVVIGVHNFANVFAYSTNGGSDTKHVNNPVDFYFDAIGGWTSI